MSERGSVLLTEIHPRNLLSFGANAKSLELDNLNILVGPNGSGKSNLIEAIALLRASPTDLRAVIRRGGGIGEWIWKGDSNGEASLGAVVAYPHGRQSVRHVLSFVQNSQGFKLEDERIENEFPYDNNEEPYFYYRNRRGRPVLNVGGDQRYLKQETVEQDQSILAQRRDPETYPEISFLANRYEAIRIYREWSFGRTAVFRQPQAADLRSDRLEEDFSNLGLVLSNLRKQPRVKRAILEALSDLYEGLDDFEVTIEGGTVQVYFTEGEYSIPATRLSDGTLRYLCLLAVLCDPAPPPLVCIEEPELGMHPDLIPKIADLLRSAAERTQLIVTTHSDVLVDAMSQTPEAIVVCEKHEGQTEMVRLNHKHLGAWLDKYRLGELWTRGEIGGTRW